MKKIVISILTLWAFIQCDKQIDENSIPEDSVKTESVFTDQKGIKATINGLYSKLQYADVANGTPQVATEWQADNVHFVGSFPTFMELYTYNTLTNNLSIQVFWRDAFETIGAANIAINNISKTDKTIVNDADKKKLIAEAKFIRAYVYYQLLNWFSQPYVLDQGASPGLPIVDFPFDSTNESAFKALKRSTVAETLTFIEKDLKEVETELDDSNDNTKASKGTAQATLARLYLDKGDNNKAAEFATKVIENSHYALAADYSFYNTTDKEFVFVLVNTPQDNANSYENFDGLTTPAADGGRGDAPFSSYLIEEFNKEPKDKRFTELTKEATDAGRNNAVFSIKFPDGSNRASNAPLIRISEMYLTRAEANIKAGTSIGDTPDNDINKIRRRAGLADLQNVTLDQVLSERRKELCLEGFRRMDLLRNKRNLRPNGDKQFSEAKFGASKTIFPIPQRQIDQSEGNLTQNTGY